LDRRLHSPRGHHDLSAGPQIRQIGIRIVLLQQPDWQLIESLAKVCVAKLLVSPVHHLRLKISVPKASDSKK
jgi:hypothetical protein